MCHLGCPKSNSPPTDVVYQRISEEATLRGRGGGREEEQRTDHEGFWKAARLMSDPTNSHKHTQWNCNNREDVPVYHLLHYYPPSIPWRPSDFLSLNKDSNLLHIYSLFHWETSHCAFAFRLKGSIKVVRWAHYDLLELGRSHQSQWREEVGWLHEGRLMDG